MIIEVVEHRKEWSDLYQKEAHTIQNILGKELINVFHIGSTSVDGLKAKPIIDIMPVVHNIEAIDHYSNQFESIGYEVMGEFGIQGRRFFRKGNDRRTHHIHIFQYNNTYDILRHLALRDYLRHSPQARAEYGRLKSELASRYPTDIDSYCDGKDAFVKKLERDALKWYWHNK